jgi:hypothetical protein
MPQRGAAYLEALFTSRDFNPEKDLERGERPDCSTPAFSHLQEFLIKRGFCQMTTSSPYWSHKAEISLEPYVGGSMMDCASYSHA